MIAKLIAGIVGGIITALALTTYGAIQYTSHIAKIEHIPTPLLVKTFAVDPSWIRQGHPNFRSAEFFQTSDERTRSGIFECDASVFEWQYNADEAIYVLEGGVELEYLGNQHSLKPGDSFFFRAGTKALWKVPTFIRKTWTMHDPGKPARSLSDIVSSVAQK